MASLLTLQKFYEELAQRPALKIEEKKIYDQLRQLNTGGWNNNYSSTLLGPANRVLPTVEPVAVVPPVAPIALVAPVAAAAGPLAAAIAAVVNPAVVLMPAPLAVAAPVPIVAAPVPIVAAPVPIAANIYEEIRTDFTKGTLEGSGFDFTSVGKSIWSGQIIMEAGFKIGTFNAIVAGENPVKINKKGITLGAGMGVDRELLLTNVTRALEILLFADDAYLVRLEANPAEKAAFQAALNSTKSDLRYIALVNGYPMTILTPDLNMIKQAYSVIQPLVGRRMQWIQQNLFDPAHIYLWQPYQIEQAALDAKGKPIFKKYTIYGSELSKAMDDLPKGVTGKGLKSKSKKTKPLQADAKRLALLVASIKAGNNSKTVVREALALLKAQS